MLKENLANVEKNIEQACKNAGRSRDEVTLMRDAGNLEKTRFRNWWKNMK